MARSARPRNVVSLQRYFATLVRNHRARGWAEPAATGVRCWDWRLVQGQGRAADSLSLEVEGYVDMVGDLDERDALVHSVVLPVEGHYPFDFTYA